MAEYIVFDFQALQDMAYTVWFNIGSIFSMALYCFIGVLGVYLVIHLLDYLIN